jgi:hypothetical protein
MSSLTNSNPKVWGPVYWRMIAHVVNAYPKSDPSESLKASTEAFFESLADLLPCQDCRDHYNDWLLENPVKYSTESRSSLSLWVTNMKQSLPGGQKQHHIDNREAATQPLQPKSIRELRLQAQKRLIKPPKASLSSPRSTSATRSHIATRTIQNNTTAIRRIQPAAMPRVTKNAVRNASGKRGCGCGK